MKGNLPDRAQVNEYRTALENNAQKYPLTSHGHLMWDFLMGQAPLTKKGKP